MARRSVKKVGAVLNFKNMSTKRRVKLPIEGIMKRSNKKGRTIGIAYAYTNSGDKVVQIVSNERRTTKRRKSSKKKRTGKKRH